MNAKRKLEKLRERIEKIRAEESKLEVQYVRELLEKVKEKIACSGKLDWSNWPSKPSESFGIYHYRDDTFDLNIAYFLTPNGELKIRTTDKDGKTNTKPYNPLDLIVKESKYNHSANRGIIDGLEEALMGSEEFYRKIRSHVI